MMLKGEAKKFGSGIDGKIVTVTGKLIGYRGKPEILVTNIKHLSKAKLTKQIDKVVENKQNGLACSDSSRDDKSG